MSSKKNSHLLGGDTIFQLANIPLFFEVWKNIATKLLFKRNFINNFIYF